MPRVRYQRGVPRERSADPRKYEAGRLLTFRRHNTDGFKSQLKRGDVVRVMSHCTCGVTGGINVMRITDGHHDFIFPEEVNVRRQRKIGAD